MMTFEGVLRACLCAAHNQSNTMLQTATLLPVGIAMHRIVLRSIGVQYLRNVVNA
jgi:hypothetical protein